MKAKIYNYDNLVDSEIDEVVVRIKALLMHANKDIILVYSHNTFQFPGGHLEDNETFIDCLLREIKEETGIVIDSYNGEPFFKISHYSKNYRGTTKNRRNDIYYYVVNTDKDVDLLNTSFDDWEKEGNFEVKTVKFDSIEHTLIDSILDGSTNKGIVEEMLEAIKEFKKNC